MKAYFYDTEMRYIGCRDLAEGESLPQNATTKSVALTDGQQAHQINGVWIVSSIPAEPTSIETASPSLEEVVIDLIDKLSEKGLIP